MTSQLCKWGYHPQRSDRGRPEGSPHKGVRDEPSGWAAGGEPTVHMHASYQAAPVSSPTATTTVGGTFVDLRRTIARIAKKSILSKTTCDHMSSMGLLDKRSRISIGESRAPRSGAGEFSCRNLSSHHTRTHANGGFSPLIVSYRSPRMKQPFFSVNNHSSAQNSKAQHTSQTNEFL